MKKVVLTLLIGLMANSALGCTLGQVALELVFAKDQSTIENQQIVRLAQWLDLWNERDGPGSPLGEIDVSANATKGNLESLQIARARAANVVRLVKAGDSRRRPVLGGLILYDLPTGEPAAFMDQVTVSIQPACVITQSCCPKAVSRE